MVHWYNIDDHGPPVFEPHNKTVRISDAFGLGKSHIVFSDDITIRNSVMRNKKSRYDENLILKSGGMIALKNQRSAEIFGITEEDEQDDEDGDEEELDNKLLKEIRRNLDKNSSMNEYQILFNRR